MSDNTENSREGGRDFESREFSAREQSTRETNPFLNDMGDANEVLPYIPDDDKYHYAFLRATIGGVFDGRNIASRTRGKLRYEPVPANEKPDLAMMATRSKHPVLGMSVIQIEDVILYRCDIKMYRFYMQAKEIEAKKALAQVRKNAREKYSAPSGYEGIGAIQVTEDIVKGGIANYQSGEGDDKHSFE